MKVDGIGAVLPQISLDKGGKSEKGFSEIFDKALAAKEDAELKEAAKQLEAMFIYQMYSQMRKTIDKGGLLKQSIGEEIFTGMLDNEISSKAAETGKLGLAEIIYQQFTRK
ncbi:rod-binding protein [Phosphitispora sp. TUW77]|uniref:rod-binding protein n=1 Tax=Phosphitispora sp. TUW77 TaxID=3152361 RepID=UPI003AB6233D